MRLGPNAAPAIGWDSPWDVRMTRRDRPPEDAVVPAAELADADDRALVAAFRAGRREAFDEIMARHQRTVYQVCHRFFGNHEDASDLAQETFIRAFKGLPKFKGQSALGTWLYRVAVNACLNRLAVKRPETEPLDAAPRIDTSADNPLQRLVRGEQSAVVRAAIERLAPKQRATLVLRVYQGLSHEEIARVLGSSVGAVKANFFHALGNLRRLLQTS